VLRSPKAGVIRRLGDLCAGFRSYVDVFTATPAFGGDQLRSHLRTLALRRQSTNILQAIAEEAFLKSLLETLQLWGIGTRGGFTLVSVPDLKAQLMRISHMLVPLESLHIEAKTVDPVKTSITMWRAMSQLEVVARGGEAAQSKIVSGTKTLHHLLPDLIFPIDREYTQTFFGWTSTFHNDESGCFTYAFVQLAKIAQVVKPSAFVRDGWNSSASKVLDNALVGYCLVHRLKSKQKQYQQRQQAILAEFKARLKRAGQWEEFQTLFRLGRLDEFKLRISVDEPPRPEPTDTMPEC
jgi:hypothetical protein